MHRQRWTEQEFGLEPRASTQEVSRTGGSRKSTRGSTSVRQRQLRALVDIPGQVHVVVGRDEAVIRARLAPRRLVLGAGAGP